MITTAIVSTIYPKNLPFWGKFLESLERQTEKRFILILLNDGCNRKDLFREQPSFNVQVHDLRGTPTRIRKEGIKIVKEAKQIQNIIFADTDDYFSKDRVEVCVALLNKYKIVFNELILFGDNIKRQSPMLGGKLKPNSLISARDIIHGNCLGLSNTSIKASCVPAQIDEIPDEVIAFDWAFYSLAMLQGTKAIFTEDVVTYYRQHSQNSASRVDFSKERILNCIKIKAQHYHFLKNYSPDYLKPSYDFKNMLIELENNDNLLQKFQKVVSDQALPNSFWWEEVNLPTYMQIAGAV